MKRMKLSAVAALGIMAVSGCSTIDSGGFSLFEEQTVLLGRASTEAMDLAVELSTVNDVETIEENPLELDRVLLRRDGDFSMVGDSLSVTSALVSARGAMSSSSLALQNYALVLSALAAHRELPCLLPEGIHGILEPGPAVTLVQFLAGLGRETRDSETIKHAMEAAAPGLDSLASAAAEVLRITAISVQSAYDDITARRRMSIVLHSGTEDQIEEIISLNGQVTELLAVLEILHHSWLSIPLIHEELSKTMDEPRLPVSLKILANRFEVLFPEAESHH